MAHATFHINLNQQQILPFYDGSKSRIVVKTDRAGTMSLPWRVLQPYVTASGLTGAFVITYDASGKWKEIRKL
jgi:hypothetical protein